MSASLRVGVIGCGRMGKCRAAAATAYGATVAFVSDVNAELANDVAQHFENCEAFPPDRLEFDSVDALFICTPPSERGATELAAIRQGIPFLIEKPVGLSAKAVTPIRSALIETPTLAAVGYMNRYRDSVQTVRRQLRGQPILGMSADWLVGMYGVPWWSQITGSGGPINEQATHIVDLARYLVDEIVAVQAIAQPILSHPDLIGLATINLRFEDGQCCSMLYSCQAKEKMIGLQVYTEEQVFRLSGWDFHLADDETTKVAYEDRNQIFDTEVRAFLDAVRSDDPSSVLCTFEDAFATQHVVDAIHRAVESGRLEEVRSE